MVEGHQCHRVAHAHRRLLLGKAFEARSPNGRFKEGAAAINGQPLQRIEVHGKNLFYMFGAGGPTSPSLVTMHIHFGMSGAFRTMSLPGKEPTETTRLELVNRPAGLIAHLSAMTVAHGPLDLYHSKVAQLGPDPLREDADKELLWAKLQRSRKPIGLCLMDQSMVAGIGNIYRAEVLFKAGVHPEMPACSVGRPTFEVLWRHSVELLQRGFVSGSILTVDPEEAKLLGKPWTRRYIYNQKQCGRCKGVVRTWDMAGRTVYCCETCQPLVGTPAAAGAQAAGGAAGDTTQGPVLLTPARAAAMAAAQPTRVFRSRCAPDDPQELTLDKLTASELRTRLLALNMDTRGRKAELLARLAAALKWEWAAGPGPAPGSGAEDDGNGAAGAAGSPPRTAAAAAAGEGGSSRQEDAAEQQTFSGEETLSSSGSEDEVDLAEALLASSMMPQLGAHRASATEEAPASASEGHDGAGVGPGLPRQDAGREEAPARRDGSQGAPAAAWDGSKLTVAQLRVQARALGLSTAGSKQQLVERLAAVAGPSTGPASALPPAPFSPPPAPAPRPAPGTAAAAAAMYAPWASPPAPAAASLPPLPRLPALRPRPAPSVATPANSGSQAAASDAAAGVASVADDAATAPVSAPSPFRAGFNTLPPMPGAPRKGRAPAKRRDPETPTASGTTPRRLAKAPRVQLAGSKAAGTTLAAVDSAAPVAGGPVPSPIVPGTAHLAHEMASAMAAAEEKLRAGESRAVEHVALHDDEEAALLQQQQ